VQEREGVGEVGIARREDREQLVDVRLRSLDDSPDPLHRVRQEVQSALFRRDRLLPVPLVDVGAVVVVEEVVLAHGPHVGEEPFSGLHAELLERGSLPLGGRLNHLGVDRVLAVVVRDAELDGPAGAVTVEVVVDAALGIHDERHFDRDQVQFPAEVVLVYLLTAVIALWVSFGLSRDL